jgi:hypothetical protein
VRLNRPQRAHGFTVSKGNASPRSSCVVFTVKHDGDSHVQPSPLSLPAASSLLILLSMFML